MSSDFESGDKRQMSFNQKTIKFLTPILFPFVKLYWKVIKPKSFGVKIIIECNGKFLLIRNSYGYKRWTFPGGKIEKGEESEFSAKREVGEELGIDLSEVKLLGEVFSDLEGKRDTIYIYYSKINNSLLKIDKFEIEEAKWFNEKDFPELSPVAGNVWHIFSDRNKLSK